MGGNALTKPSVRLERPEFDLISAMVSKKLLEFYGTRVCPILFYKEKDSFGDLDILIEKPEMDYREELENLLYSYFNVTEIKRNSAVWSVGLPLDEDLKNSRVFQIDLIHMKSKYFDTSYFYYSFNDLNNLVGKMIHKFGLKFGHKGLIMPLRNDTGGVKKEIIVTQEPSKIYEFIGLDYSKWKDGFNSLEEIFKFVVSSPYFSADMFSDENLNHRSRVRDKKRKVYNSFRTWLEKTEHSQRHYSFNKNKEEYIDFIDKTFPGAQVKVQRDAFFKELEEKRIIAQKFNGNIVMELTRLSGKELGKFISDFKKSIKDFNLWVKHSSSSEVNEKILKFKESQVEIDK